MTMLGFRDAVKADNGSDNASLMTGENSEQVTTEIVTTSGELPPDTSNVDSAIHVLETYATPLVCGFGCLGNLICLLVLTRARFRKYEKAGKDTGAYFGLFLLAASDLLVCSSLLPRGFVKSSKAAFYSASFGLYYQLYGTAVSTTFVLTSTWIVVTLAVMRYLGICHPFWSRSYLRQDRAKLTYALVIIASVCLNIPMFYHYTLVTYVDLEGNVIYISDLGPMDPIDGPGLTYYYVRSVFSLLLPAIALSFCNFSLIRTLRQSRRMRQRYRASETVRPDNKSRVTLTLVIVAISFVLMVLPAQLMDFFISAIENDASKLPTFSMCRVVANVLEAICFSFNFVFYFSMNHQFRGALADLCAWGSRKVYNTREMAQRKSFVRSASFSGSGRLSTTWSFTRTKSNAGSSAMTCNDVQSHAMACNVANDVE